MIELSLGKMVLLALIALIVLGPEKLPGAARTAGALLRRVRSGWDNVKAEVERELEIEEIRRSAREAVAGAEAAQQRVKDTLKQAHDPFAEAAAMVRLAPPASTDIPRRAEDMTPEERVTNRHLLQSTTDDVLPESTTRIREHSAETRPADEQALEGVQSELPLDEPSAGAPHTAHAPDRNAKHGDA
jgi:sec-independent protein translocase protein TatB